MNLENNNYVEIITFNNYECEKLLLENNNKKIKAIEKAFSVNLLIRQNIVYIENKEDINLEIICIILKTLETLCDNNIELTDSDFYSIISNINKDNYLSILNIFLKKEVIYNTSNGKTIYPRTVNQKIYINALENNDIIFALGPAGTGKTYLGILFALKMLKNNEIRKIILTRPIVEAGEKLGFLPGDLKEKIDPYLIPLYDGLYEGLGKSNCDRLIEKGIIEIAPLAYMRGRTLENAVVILDEAQNTTLSQMKMFLTRLGFNSKMIITGDITQIDLPNKNYSGLIEASKILDDIEGIKIIKFSKYDVMRHPLVFKIIQKYEDNNI